MRRPRLFAQCGGLAAVSVMLLSGCAAAEADPSSGSASLLFRLATVRPAAAQRETAIRVERVPAPPTSDYGWSIDRLDPTSSELGISWVDSPDIACGRADLVQVHETEEAVVIGVRDTRVRLPLACSDAGLGHVAAVQLRRPVGERALVVPLRESDVTGTTAEFRHSLITAPGDLPDPACGVTGTPVGMADAGTALAPHSPRAVVVCRYSWGDSGTEITRVSIDDPTEVAALAARVNRSVTALRSARADAECDEVERTHYALVFSGPRMLAPIRTDAPGCGEVTNGVIAASTTAALTRALDSLFTDDS